MSSGKQRQKKMSGSIGNEPTAGGHGTLEWRTCTVLALLVFVAIWPLVHRGLVGPLDLNPWKLSAFAMYTVPVPPTVTLLFEPGAGALRIIEEATLPDPAREVLRDFKRNRHALGKLRRPDDVAAAVFEGLPALEELVVSVQRMSLDRDTALMHASTQSYVYERSELARTGTALPVELPENIQVVR